jgi:CRISPR-associated protein Cas6
MRCVKPCPPESLSATHTMFWQEKPEEKRFETSDEVIDLCFNLECKTLPLDHAWPLSTALTEAAPWLKSTDFTAIHLIHGAESGNGWMRPDNTENELLHLSRRARFTLRLHRDNLALADELIGLQLDIKGHPLTLKGHKPQLLVPQTTIFSRYIVSSDKLSEDHFLHQIAPDIQTLGISIKKMMGGLPHTFNTPKGIITTRSLMLSDLEPEESIRLQQHGLGDHQLLGMGIFLPHKGIAAVQEINEEIPQEQALKASLQK